MKILSEVDHPFIIKFIETFEFKGLQWIITDYVSGGTLKDILDKQLSLSLDEAMSYFVMMLLGLHYLH